MEDVPRPVAAPSFVDRGREWVAWFGLARLVTAAVAVVIVCGGAWLLTRAPVPPSEASLPRASAESAPSETLPVLVPVVSADRAEAIDELIVHVAGAVVAPGVYELDAGSRVESAIVAAGGAIDGADMNALNLAAIVADGSRIYVPELGEVVPMLAADRAGTASAPSGPVDVNRASSAELETLPGVGPATATAIVAERERNGPFVSVDDLERVPGIGPAKLAGLIDAVTT